MAEKSKKYVYEWEDYEDGKKNAKTMAEEILTDPQLPELEEIIIGCWGESWENSAQSIIDSIVANKEKFTGIKSLFVGDMDYEECEVSWIEQADYSALWETLPGLERLTIKGGTNLSLGKICQVKASRDHLWRSPQRGACQHRRGRIAGTGRASAVSWCG